MKIGIDARPLRHPYTGIGKYLEQILRELAEADKENEYFLYCHQDFDLRFTVNHKWHKRIGWGGVGTIWLHTQLPFMMTKDKLDVFWGPQYAIPFWPQKIPRVVTVHDLVFHHYPETLPTLISLHNKLILKYYLATANQVIAVSHSTKKDLFKVYKLNDSKVQVVHLAAKCDSLNAQTNNSSKDVLDKFGVAPGYLLYVGTVEPRKNIIRLLEAYAMLSTVQFIKVPLVIAGGMGWKYKGIIAKVGELGLKDQVIFTGFLTEAEQDQIYLNAAIFIYPSLYEGFGLPPLEAMLRGIPVITSNTSSIPEVVGNAAMMVDPYNVEELAKTIELLYEDEDLRYNYSVKGIERSKEFSWEKAATTTLRILIETAEGNRRLSN